jgi:ketosteroid isomerase-like protein
MHSKLTPTSLLAAVLIALGAASQPAIPAPMQAMADTERAFAKAATVKGVRDAFLEFFADDSIALRPGPVPAKDGLRKQQPRPFSESGIIWEPRTGDVAASGDLGWLTGPATFTKGADATPVGYGCYLSVWRLTGDGVWRVLIDIGTDLPKPTDFAPGLTRAVVERPYRGAESREAASAGLLEVDRALNKASTAGAAKAYAAVLTPLSRLHRPGRVSVGPTSIAGYLESEQRIARESGTAATARSADVGYSYGTYESSSGKPESGPYLRVWSRDDAGRWWLMAEVAHPTR